MATAVFPRQAEAAIDKMEVRSRISLENDKHPQGQVILHFLYQFLDEISQTAEVKNDVAVECNNLNQKWFPSQSQTLSFYPLHVFLKLCDFSNLLPMTFAMMLMFI